VKICLVDNRSPNSLADGAAVYVAQLGPALAQDHRVSVVTLKPGTAHLLRAIRAIRRMIVSDQPDVVHLNNLSGLTPAAVLWAIDDRIPVALSLHDYRLIDGWRALNRSVTARIGLVISPSNYALDRHLRHGFFDQAIKMVLPYGIDSPLTESSSPLEREGRGGDLCIFRSTYPEPFPVAIQEAMRGGKIVIASRIGGIPEMVRDGVNGLLVEPGDESAISAAIDRLRQSPELAARLRASALETARLYDMRFHIARLTDAYRQLLTARRAGDLDHRAA
jgi:glycosyltransferase involved in cell wall biosynthesis